jgi:hypothetical protein
MDSLKYSGKRTWKGGAACATNPLVEAGALVVAQRLGAIDNSVASVHEVKSTENSVVGEAHLRKGIAKKFGAILRVVVAVRHSVDSFGEIEMFEVEVALAPQTNILDQGILVSRVEDDDLDRSPW